jgi:hypothetical protein
MDGFTRYLLLCFIQYEVEYKLNTKRLMTHVHVP